MNFNSIAPRTREERVNENYYILKNKIDFYER